MPEESKNTPDTKDVAEIVEAPVDFDNAESRMNFLKSQLNDLLDGINNVYGQELMEELLKRLEKTVESFNIEVSGLMGKLKAGKIFEEEAPQEATSPASAFNEPADDHDHTPELSFEDQEAEDADIIARMRKRISND